MKITISILTTILIFSCSGISVKEYIAKNLIIPDSNLYLPISMPYQTTSTALYNIKLMDKSKLLLNENITINLKKGEYAYFKLNRVEGDNKLFYCQDILIKSGLVISSYIANAKMEITSPYPEFSDDTIHIIDMILEIFTPRNISYLLDMGYSIDKSHALYRYNKFNHKATLICIKKGNKPIAKAIIQDSFPFKLYYFTYRIEDKILILYLLK